MKDGLTASKVLRDARFLWIVFRAIEGDSLWTRRAENFGHFIRPVVAEVIGDDLDSRRKIRGHCTVGSVLKFGDGIHKSTRNVERRHADVDVEHNSPEGGASGGIESLEGMKHGTETILTILLCGEKVTIFSSLNRRSRCALLNDEVEGGDERQEIPSPLGQVRIAISVQNRVGMTLKKGRQDHSLVKLFRV